MGQWGRIALGVVLAVVMALGMCPAQVRAEEVVEVASVGESEGAQSQDTAESDDVQLEPQYADVVEVTITGIEPPQCYGDLVVALKLLNTTLYSDRTVTLKLVNDTTVTQDYYASHFYSVQQANTTIDLNGCTANMTDHELKVANRYKTGPTLTITDTAGGGVLDACYILVDAYANESFDSIPGNLVIRGGTINGCVKLDASDNTRRAECLMTDGTITNKNGAMKNGVGVNVGGDYASTFAMTGGSVTGCVGGGVTVGANGTLKVSGAPVVTGNTKDGQACNVYLPEGKTIEVADELADGARIGVTTQAEPTADSSVAITSGFSANNPGVDPARFFVSDDPSYYVGLEGGEAVLKPHTHAWQWEASGNMLTATCAEHCTAVGGNVQTLTLVAKDKTYDGKPVDATVQASADWKATGTAAGDVAYYAGGKQLAAAPKDAGAYEARVTVSAAGTPYELVAPFSIKKAPLTVAARDNAVTFGEAPAGAGVTYSGFAAGEGKQVLSGTLAYDFGGCQAGSPVGTYPITPSGLRASNYDIVYKAGTLTVCAPDACAVTAVAHVQRKGTLEPSTGVGEVVGTTGSSLRLESLRLSLFGQQLPGGIEYRAHVQRIGWQGWVADGALAGTQGKSRRVEAFQMRLTGRMAECYDVYYRVHAQRYGWMAWAKNGASAGTQGRSLRVEAVQVVVVRKGSPAPGTTYHGVVQTYTKPFVKR